MLSHIRLSVSDKVATHLLACLTIRAKMIGEGNLFYLKFWVKLTALERNRRFLANVNSKFTFAICRRPSVCRLSSVYL